MPRRWYRRAWGSLHEPRIAMFDPSGVRSPVSRWSLRPSTPTGTLNARTLAGQTQAMRDLVSADHRGPVIAIHSPRECQVPDCDIPPVRLMVLGASQSQRSARVDTAARSWSLPYRAVDPRETKMPGAAPVVTWGEWQALGEAPDPSLTVLQVLIDADTGRPYAVEA